MVARKPPVDCPPAAFGGGADGQVDCRCRDAVRRCYDRMRQIGLPQAHALDAASRVYRHYHPEVSQDLGRLTVECWVATERLH